MLLTGIQICKEPMCGQRFSQLGNLKVGNRYALLVRTVVF